MHFYITQKNVRTSNRLDLQRRSCRCDKSDIFLEILDDNPASIDPEERFRFRRRRSETADELFLADNRDNILPDILNDIITVSAAK